MKLIRVFWGYIQFFAKKQFAYRIYSVTEVMGNLIIPVLLNLLLWNNLIANNPVKYSFPQMVQYIIVSNPIMLFTQVDLHSRMQRDIKTYRLGHKLLHPVGYARDLLLNCISASIIRFIVIYLPLFIAVRLFVGDWGKALLLPGAISLSIAFALNSLLSFIIGASSFWFTEIWGISALRTLLSGLFAGTLFPLDILSAETQRALMISPFPYMAYVPAKLITGSGFSASDFVLALPVAGIWLAVLTAAAIFMWRMGVKRYTSTEA